jgi:hypothetical protein
VQDRARAGFALMVVIAVLLGVLIGTRNIRGEQDEGMFSMSGLLWVSDDAASEEVMAREADYSDLEGESIWGGSDTLDSLRFEREQTRSTQAETLELIARDALVFVRGDSCDVVIAGKELTKTEAEQIGDIVARSLGVDLRNITIVEQGDTR